MMSCDEAAWRLCVHSALALWHAVMLKFKLVLCLQLLYRIQNILRFDKDIAKIRWQFFLTDMVH